MDGRPTPRRRPSWRRRLFRGLVLLILVAGGTFAGLPWLLGTAPGRRALESGVNRVLAPSRVKLGGVSASWFRPTHLYGLVLTNGEGKTLIRARQAVIGQGLLHVAMKPMRIGTILVEGADVDIERRADGSIDLVDALVPPSPAPAASEAAPAKEPAAPGKPLDVTLRVVRGTLRLKTPELAAPLEAGQLDMQVHLPADSSRPLNWKIRLGTPPGASDAQGETLALDGTYDHRAASDPDLTLHIKGERWPLTLAGGSLGADAVVKARLDGLVLLERKGGKYESSGDATLADVDAAGPVLGGDRVRLSRVVAGWDVGQPASETMGWELRRLAVKSDVAEVSGTGSLSKDGKTPVLKAEANLNLAALAGQLPRLLHLRQGITLERGSAQINVDLGAEGETQRGEILAKLSDLAARDATHAFTLGAPATLAARATRTTTGFNVQTLSVKSAFVSLESSGDLDRGLTLKGTLDLGGLQAQLRDAVDFGGVTLAGKGTMAADYRKSAKGAFLARYAAEVTGLKVVGLTAEPIVRDRARFDAAMNGPLGESGIPADWQALRVNLKSARDAVTLSAGNQAGTVTASASASVPWKVLERQAQLGAKLAGRWKPRPEGALAEFDELAVTLVPTDPALASKGTLAFSARGRLDLAADTLSLTPSPTAATVKSAAALGPNGLMLKGISKTPVERRSGRLSLAGDLAALDRALTVWTAGSEKGIGGPYTLDVAFTPDATGALNLGLGMVVAELTRAGSDGKSRTKEGPVSLSVAGTYRSGEDRFDLADLKFASRYGMLSGSGRVDEPAGKQVAELQGNLEPNWGMISALAAQSLEPNVRFEGGTRPFHVKGPLSAGSLAALLKGLDAEVGLDLASADVFGMRLGPAPIVLRCGGGNVTIDSIQTTLNGGRVDLKPGLDVDDARGIALTLAPGSSLKDVAVNDEVSRRVLRYIAPVLDKATHVNGRIAMNVEKADIPLSAPPERRLTLTGQLVFQDVVFAPGPFAGEVLALAGRPDSAGLKLHQPVQFSVADGRVMQKGLEIPVNKDAKVAFEGSVGFDESLDLRASVPITKGMLGQVAGLKDVVGDNRVTVPIGGTVTQPRINRQALQVALKEMSKDMLKRGMTRQAQGLIDRIAPQPEGAPAGEAGQGSTSGDPLQNLQDRLLKRLAPRPRPTAPPAGAGQP